MSTSIVWHPNSKNTIYIHTYDGGVGKVSFTFSLDGNPESIKDFISKLNEGLAVPVKCKYLCYPNLWWIAKEGRFRINDNSGNIDIYLPASSSLCHDITTWLMHIYQNKTHAKL